VSAVLVPAAKDTQFSFEYLVRLALGLWVERARLIRAPSMIEMAHSWRASSTSALGGEVRGATLGGEW